ncbi:peptidase M28 family [Rhizoctonia solani]|uniref:Peptide hydrolase n=1 Tax=Rhizoctonia solani TaxID=456999 RepID=A0A8H7M3K3_9AGAM|nr:peptidase M28 family [Rhizoctonia solani]
MKFTRALALGSICLSAVFAAPVSDFDANVAKGLRLIQTSEDTAPFWATEDQKLDLLRADKGFFDLTETYHQVEEQKAKGIKAIVERATYPSPSKSSTVKSIISTLSTSRMQSNLATLTSYNNRYYTSSTGSSSSTWIYNQLVSIASGKSGITFNGASTSAAAVIFGCHIDSINLSSPSSGRAPGADDNGTGTVNLIEVFRALVTAGFSPARPVEFHFYAAEEVGLLGSQAIAANYKSSGKAVYAMINLDMTGYFKPGSTEVIALVTDRVDSGLNTYLRSLISAYCSIPAGTDYATLRPSPSRAPTVSENPNIHSSSDTTSVNGFSWTHSLEFAKLATAAAVELGSV